MDVEDDADSLGDFRIEADKAHGQHFYTHDVCFKEVAHEYSGKRNSEDQEEREIIANEGNITNLGQADSSDEQIGHGAKKKDIGQVEKRYSDLKETVETFHQLHRCRHLLRKEPKVPDQDQEE